MAFPVFAPGPHYRVMDVTGCLPLLVYPDPFWDSHQDAAQFLEELAADVDVDATGAQVVPVTGGFWLARCSVCGEDAEDEAYVWPTFAEAVETCVVINQMLRDTKWTAPGPPLWFASAARQDLRCRAHAEPGDVSAGEVAR